MLLPNGEERYVTSLITAAKETIKPQTIQVSQRVETRGLIYKDSGKRSYKFHGAIFTLGIMYISSVDMSYHNFHKSVFLNETGAHFQRVWSSGCGS